MVRGSTDCIVDQHSTKENVGGVGRFCGKCRIAGLICN